jgi:branched-chain amino acid transport system permease protein
MTSDIALLLAQDGITSAAIYALLAISLILIFTVTRIIYVPQGEFISFGALTLAAIQQGELPKSIAVLAVLGAVAAVYELATALRLRISPNAFFVAFALVYPGLLWGLLRYLDLRSAGILTQIAATMLIVVPLGPMIYRIVFQPIAGSKVLVLLIAAVATQLVLVGLALLSFGPEGARTKPLGEGAIQVGGLLVSWQSIITIGLCIALIGVFAWSLSYTLRGKALRATAVNRRGARIVGISPTAAGHICFIVAAAVGVISGALIAPVSTMYYDSGFLIGLKGFVAAIFGGLVSYPIAAVGALSLGLAESFVSFWTSAFKEVVVFSLLIPVLLIRSLTSSVVVDEGE